MVPQPPLSASERIDLEMSEQRQQIFFLIRWAGSPAAKSRFSAWSKKDSILFLCSSWAEAFKEEKWGITLGPVSVTWPGQLFNKSTWI